MATMKLTIVTPERGFYTGEVEGIKLKGPDGYFEVLPRHCDLVAALVPSEIRIKDAEGKDRKAFASTGFVEVNKKGVSVLVDAAEWPDEIDAERAEAALGRAQGRLAEKSGTDILRAELALKRALARKKVASGL